MYLSLNVSLLGCDFKISFDLLETLEYLPYQVLLIEIFVHFIFLLFNLIIDPKMEKVLAIE